MGKKLQIKVATRPLRLRKCPKKFTITIKYDNEKKSATLESEPTAPTTVVQNVLRSTLTILDKSYPPKDVMLAYIS